MCCSVDATPTRKWNKKLQFRFTVADQTSRKLSMRIRHCGYGLASFLQLSEAIVAAFARC